MFLTCMRTTVAALILFSAAQAQTAKGRDDKATRDAKVEAAWADCLKHIVSGDPKLGASHKFAPGYVECIGIELNKTLKDSGVDY